jgi:uncharacterized protein (DUF427 family)
MKAVWNGTVLAESDDCLVIEGNHYFPPDSVHREFFVPSETALECDGKGPCTFYALMVEADELKDGAWTFEQLDPTAVEKSGADFANYVSFWHGVEIVDEDHHVHYLTPGPAPDKG